MQLEKKHATAAVGHLRHWEKTAVAELGHKVGREVTRPAKFTRHGGEVIAKALQLSD